MNNSNSSFFVEKDVSRETSNTRNGVKVLKFKI